MESSLLGRLPAEIRNLIYEYALYESSGVPICTEPGLLRTSSTIRRETELMFYALNDFHAEIHEERLSHNLCKWLRVKAGARIRLINSLNIHCEMPSIGIKGATSGTRPESEDTETDSHIVGFLMLMHIMDSIRKSTFDKDLENLIRFTLNGADDAQPLEKIDSMSLEDQDRYRGAKFLIMTLVHGEQAVMDAIDAGDSEDRLNELDRAIQARRIESARNGIS